MSWLHVAWCSSAIPFFLPSSCALLCLFSSPLSSSPFSITGVILSLKEAAEGTELQVSGWDLCTDLTWSISLTSCRLLGAEAGMLRICAQSSFSLRCIPQCYSYLPARACICFRGKIMVCMALYWYKGGHVVGSESLFPRWRSCWGWMRKMGQTSM